jgi:ClpP class serine protease
MNGLRVELFKSGRHKGMGQPGTSLTDEQRALLQSRVDVIGKRFRADVCSGRRCEIAEEVMQGQSFDAQECLVNGLVDGVCDFDTALRNAAFMGRMKKQKGK